MIAQLRKASALLGASLLIWSCGEMLAGRTVETTNGISARAVLPSGDAVAFAPATLIDQKEWLDLAKDGKDVTLSSAMTDMEGKFFLKMPDSTYPANLLITIDNYGIFVPQATQGTIDRNFGKQIQLRRLVNYAGIVKDTNFISKRVLLAGTPFTAPIDSATGKFLFKDLPQQRYSLLVHRIKPDLAEEYVVAKEIEVSEWSRPGDTVVPDTSKILLLEDFEDMDNRGKLGILLGGGYWDAYSDLNVGGSSRLTLPIDAGPGNFPAAIQNGGGARDHSLHVKYAAGPGHGSEKDYAYVALDLRLGSTQYSLEKFDTLSFFARGSGELVVEFMQFPAALGVQIYATGPRLTLTDTAVWQEFKIVPSQLTVRAIQFPVNPESKRDAFLAAKIPPYTQRPTTWQEMGGVAGNIRFLGTGGKEFWLDHIRLHGMDFGDLAK